MEVTPESVKQWLSRYPDRDRHWLAKQCGDTEKSTVDNWLSSPRGIPSKARIIIEGLMKADEEIERAKNPAPPMSLVLEVSPERFDAYNRSANKRGSIIRDWAVEVLNRAADRDAAAAVNRNTVPFERPVEKNAEGLKYWVPLRGGVAAGEQMAYVQESDLPVEKEYPSDHYALKVFGQSMEPKIPDGSTIIVREWSSVHTPRKGTIVVYSDGSGSSLKEYGYRKATSKDDPEMVNRMGDVAVLRSLNKAFPDVQTMEGGRIDAVLVEVI